MSKDLFCDVAALAPPVEGPSDEQVARQRERLVECIDGTGVTSPARTARRRRRLALISAAAAVAVAAGVLGVVLSSSAPPLRRFTTSWRAARPLRNVIVPAGARARPGSDVWRLTSFLVPSGWQQNTAGPQPGYLICPSSTACYVTSDTSPSASGPADWDALYVSSDAGATWSVLPLPAGTTFSSPLSCTDSLSCAAGAFVDGAAALLFTDDGGHQWTVQPVPAGTNPLVWIRCSSPELCAGVTAPSNVAQSNGLGSLFGPYRNGLDENPDEAFATTSDAGVTWSSSPFPASDAIKALECPTPSNCVAIGYDTADLRDAISGFVFTSTDRGAAWSTGTLPGGFGIGYLSALSCGDALHCMAIGNVMVPNPTPCASAAAKSIGSCQSEIAVSGIATTNDGGSTWQLDQLPSDVPQPSLGNVACASASTCWVSGEEAVPVQIGNVEDGGSAVLLGTTDGGATWSRVTFEVPAGAPNFDGQSYQAIGSISCPGTTDCLALGITAQGSPTAPIYRLFGSAP